MTKKVIEPNTKEKIIKTSLRLFLENGFHNVSMQNIANEVRISKPAIYHHYKNKDEMIEAVLDYFTEIMRKWAQNYFKETSSDIKQYLKKSFEATSFFKNVEKILLVNEKDINNLKYTYNEFLITVTKYSEKLKDRISSDIINTRKANELLFQDAQKNKIINNKFTPKSLAIYATFYYRGSIFYG